MGGGTTTRLTASEFISGSTAGSTSVSGMRTTCKVTVFTNMLTESVTMESINRIRKMDSVIITGPMAANTQAGGPRVSSTA